LNEEDEGDPEKIFGSVVLTRLTTDVHPATIDALMTSARRNVCELAGGDLNVFWSISGKPGMDCNIGPYIHRKLDGGLIPDQVQVGGDVLAAYDNRPFPNIALEVAYRNEDYDKLVQELLELISPWTSVQVAIGIKIENQRHHEEEGDVLMTAYVFKRPEPDGDVETTIFSDDQNQIPQFPPDQIVAFGTDVEYPIGGLRITFPLQALYFGVDITFIPPPVAAAIADNTLIEINLEPLRDRIVSCI
jgi:hypothetical protein